MPKLTPEKINEIESKFSSVSWPETVTFSQNTDVAAIQKLVLFYRLKKGNCIYKPNANEYKKTQYQKYVNAVTAAPGSPEADPLVQFLSDDKIDAVRTYSNDDTDLIDTKDGVGLVRSAAIEELLQVSKLCETIDNIAGIYYRPISHFSDKNITRQRIYDEFFNPVVTLTEAEQKAVNNLDKSLDPDVLPRKADKSIDYSIAIPQALQKLAAAKITDLPEGISHDDACLALFGNFLEKDNVAACVTEEGKAGVFSTQGLSNGYQSGLTLIFDSMLTDNTRTNVQHSKLLMPAAREKTIEAVEEYRKGNKAPFAQAIYSAFDSILISVQDQDPEAASSPLEFEIPKLKRCAELLAPGSELSKYVKIPPEKLAILNAMEINHNLIQEKKQLIKDLSISSLQLAYNNPEKKIYTLYSDGNEEGNTNMAKIVRLLTINSHLQAVKDANSEFGEIIGNKPLTEDEINRIKDREPNRIERLLSNEADREEYMDILTTQVKKFIQDNKTIKSLYTNDCLSILENNTIAGDLSREKIGDNLLAFECFEQYENYTLPAVARTLKTVVAEDKVVEKDGKVRFKKLVEDFEALCAPERRLSKNPTSEEIRKRIQDFKALAEKAGALENDITLPPDYATSNSIEDHPTSIITAELNDVIKKYGRNLSLSDLAHDLRKNTYQKEFEKFVSEAEKEGSPYVFSNKGQSLSPAEAAKALNFNPFITAQRFKPGSPFGTEYELSKKSDRIVTNSIKAVTRVTDLSEGMDPKKPAEMMSKQVEILSELYEVLDKSDPWYMNNSSEFNNTKKLLKQIITAHKNIGDNPNIKQVTSLKTMYEQLDQSCKSYIEYKEEALANRTDDPIGKLRLDMIKTLKTGVAEGHVYSLLMGNFNEFNQFTNQTYTSSEDMKEYNNYLKNYGNMSEEEKKQTITGNLKSLADYIEKKGVCHEDKKYVQFNIAKYVAYFKGEFDSFNKKAGDKAPKLILDEKTNRTLENFKEAVINSHKKINALSADIKAPQKPKDKAPAQKTEVKGKHI